MTTEQPSGRERDVDDLLEVGLARALGLSSQAEAAPGIGSAAALATAAAAAILAGIARRSREVWAEAPGSAAQAIALRARAAHLVQAGADTYTAALEQLGEGTEPHPARRDFQLGRALQEAAEVPARVAEVAADVVELAAVIAEHGAHDARPDAVGAAMLAEAASRAAALLVSVNLAVGSDGALLGRCRESTVGAAAALARALAADL